MGETSVRLAAIRRIYFYFVALITLIAGLIALNGLLHGLTVAWSGVGEAVNVGNDAFVRTLLARNGGLLVVTAPREVQRERVLARPGMDEAALAAILARQLPDAEKRARADFILDTSEGLEAARDRVLSLIAEIREERRHA